MLDCNPFSSSKMRFNKFINHCNIGTVILSLLSVFLFIFFSFFFKNNMNIFYFHIDFLKFNPELSLDSIMMTFD